MVALFILFLSIAAVIAAIFSKKRPPESSDSSEDDLIIGVETSVPEEQVQAPPAPEKPETVLSKKFFQAHGLPE